MNRVKNERSEVQGDERKRGEREEKREKRENEVFVVKYEILVKFLLSANSWRSFSLIKKMEPIVNNYYRFLNPES